MKIVATPKELIAELLKLDDGTLYSMEIKIPKSERTIQQNKYMWKLIHKIAEVDGQDEMDIYCLALENANAKYRFLIGEDNKEVLDELRKNFRAVRVFRPQVINGKKFIVYKCFIGSSKMNTAEMNQLLDFIIMWAEEREINTDPHEPIWGD